MPVDDNAFLLAADGRQSRWRSCTSAAPNGRTCFRSRSTAATGKLQIDGLGGSYGVERLTYYRMLPEMGPPETTAGNIRGGDQSWALEFAEFLDDIRLRPSATPRAARRARGALTIVERCHRQSGFDFAPAHGRAMIITRSPLRITLGGGGTDLPSYYREHGGFLIAAAIDKYVYVTVMRPFVEGIFLKYSKLEHVEAIETSSIRSSARRSACSASGRRRSRSRRSPTFRPGPALDRPAASPRRC